MEQLKQTVVATFDGKRKAEAAVALLHQAGYGHDQISVLARDRKTARNETRTGARSVVAEAGNGGFLFSAGMGATLKLFSIIVPGARSLIVAGPVLSLLGGAVLGATARGLTSALSGLGIPETQAALFDSLIQEGKIVITVSDTQDRIVEARRILALHKPLKVLNQASVWTEIETIPELPEAEHVRVYTMPTRASRPA